MGARFWNLQRPPVPFRRIGYRTIIQTRKQGRNAGSNAAHASRKYIFLGQSCELLQTEKAQIQSGRW